MGSNRSQVELQALGDEEKAKELVAEQTRRQGPFHMSGLEVLLLVLLAGWNGSHGPLSRPNRVLISIGRHWHTLPAQVTNYSSQRNCSANVVAYCRILARMLKHVNTSQQKVWGA